MNIIENDMRDIEIVKGIDALINACYSESKEKGWHDHGTSFPEKIALIHSEISEALEGDRKDLMDDKLPEFKNSIVELGDAIIRICDIVGYLQEQAKKVSPEKANEYDLAAAIIAKRYYNKTRKDHSKEERAKSGGKKY